MLINGQQHGNIDTRDPKTTEAVLEGMSCHLAYSPPPKRRRCETIDAWSNTRHMVNMALLTTIFAQLLLLAPWQWATHI